MHWVACYGRITCATLLAQAGAALAPISDQGVSPLHSAPRASEVEMSEACLVLSRGRSEQRSI